VVGLLLLKFLWEIKVIVTIVGSVSSFSSSLISRQEVPFDEGQVLSEELVIPFFESSVEEKVNIEEAMVALLKLSMEKADLQPEKKCLIS
jgi:hypothetical protein